MNAEDVHDLADFLHYCKEHEDRIFIRAQIGQKWETTALSSLSPRDWGTHVARWIDEGRVPYRLKTEEEVEEQNG